MTLYVSQNATTGTVSRPRPAAPAHTESSAIGRAGAVWADPPLLTHAWRRVFARTTGESGRM
ncbi:multiple cyclophane-containing RiPP AmcA [Micromonospora sp. NBC_01699]|uniref:multiple cyclophane-containing RiPP AmcA n=1 Tax=Micromonospora sp. NBC_01699 TaxID=2975984 RepID=UPI002E286C8A|nr:multiple cyclophane-containing RiPP AmcA [Micromonospora sp. NBC_01699]